MIRCVTSSAVALFFSYSPLERGKEGVRCLKLIAKTKCYGFKVGGLRIIVVLF
jgi:hypothetical protein